MRHSTSPPLTATGAVAGAGAPRRGVRAIADVRAGEWAPVLLLALNGCLILCAYYVLKTAREPLILVGGHFGLAGAELKTYAAAAQAVLLLAVVPAYGRLVSKVARAQLVTATFAAMILCLLVFAGLAHVGAPIGLPYYLWLGLATLIGVAQFWSLANDLFSRQDGERLFPVIAIGGTLGAILGARLARWLLVSHPVPRLLLVGAGLLALSLFAHRIIERGQRRAARSARPPGPPRVERQGGFALVLRGRYLLLIGLMVACANLINTQGEYILARAVSAHAEAVIPATEADAADSTQEARRAVVGRIYGEFYSNVNLVALVLQTLVVSALLRTIGVHRALFVMPILALLAYATIAAVPVFSLVLFAKLIENGTDYSLHNTVRQTLFLPTSRDAKYKAKAAIDSFFFRLGDLGAAGFVLLGVHLLGLSLKGFALLNMALVVVWLGIAAAIGARYRVYTRQGAEGGGRVRAAGPT